MRKPFMVEFSGTPEAGKTTTIKTVANMLKAKGDKVGVLQESAKNYQKKLLKGLGMLTCGCIIIHKQEY